MIAVVVLTYRADPTLLEPCLASVLASGDADLVVLVDNGQTLDRRRVDATVAAAGGGTVHLITTRENLGFAGGMNAGLGHALAAGATAVAVLNDDTVVEPGWLSRLAAHLGDGVGAVQPKLLLRTPGAPAQDPPRIASVGMWVRGDGAGIDLGVGEVDAGQHDRVVELDLFTGGAVLFDRPFLEAVGGFDERYFLYYEDIDLGRRGRAAGFRYLLEPASVVHHALSSTAGATPDLYRYWQERNRLWWLFRHGRPTQVLLGLGRSLLRLAKHPTAPQASAILRGVAGAPRCVRERVAGRVLVAPLPQPGPVPWTVA